MQPADRFSVVIFKKWNVKTSVLELLENARSRIYIISILIFVWFQK